MFGLTPAFNSRVTAMAHGNIRTVNVIIYNIKFQSHNHELYNKEGVGRRGVSGLRTVSQWSNQDMVHNYK